MKFLINLIFLPLYDNGIRKDIEPNVPDIDESIETLIKLSKIVGKERISWRYDPILLTENIQ